MRTTLEIDDTLFRKARELKPIELTVSEKNGGVVRGIDLDTTAAL